MGLPETVVETPPSQQQQKRMRTASKALVWAACAILFVWFLPQRTEVRTPFVDTLSLVQSLVWNPFERAPGCKPHSPNVFAYHPPRPSDKRIVKASADLDKYLSGRAAKDDIDSISFGVITPAGILFEGGYGILKANETDAENSNLTTPVDRNTIYRIASISKMFTVFETLILREKGALNWDDPVEKYLPEFAPPSYGWANYMDGRYDSTFKMQLERPRVSLRQLASHLAGIGRDYPPEDIGEWPIDFSNGFADFYLQKMLGVSDHTYEGVMEAISQNPLVNVPYEFPIYSNTGMNLLGLSNIAANKLFSNVSAAEPQTHRDLIQRDIFNPLGFNSSFFQVPPAESPLLKHIAVASKDSEWVDLWLGDVDDPAGGQYSSLSDLAIFMKTLLSPTARGGVISASVVREWLRPLHVWGNSQQQVGAPWEITSLGDFRTYTKSGNLPGHNSQFAIIPELSVGLIVLMTGTYGDTSTIIKEAGKRILPVLDKMHTEQVEKQYAGRWTNGDDIAVVTLVKGALTMKQLIVRGVDVLGLVQNRGDTTLPPKGEPVQMWATGVGGEFRLAIGSKALNKVKDIGCMPYWATLDPGLYARGAPLDVVYWKRGVLTYPSAGISFSRGD
ncbi:hypothetical protein D9619_009769 [Psilocybe cf. subviscida]|uniref:Beta-lactamase-related domain-containing protein n=1 Tax=Psilocybe cf. subviscida TaxID=2480587 RepID=A0A8H5BLA5_9AGAR|nr:hypothetical protein D9619_009769 [Psilocybe cf. subviscida]